MKVCLYMKRINPTKEDEMFSAEGIKVFQIVYTLVAISSLVAFGVCIHKAYKIGYYGGYIPFAWAFVIGLIVGPIACIFTTVSIMLPNSQGVNVASVLSLVHFFWTLSALLIWRKIHNKLEEVEVSKKASGS